jgi:hypothetical protein
MNTLSYRSGPANCTLTQRACSGNSPQIVLQFGARAPSVRVARFNGPALHTWPESLKSDSSAGCAARQTPIAQQPGRNPHRRQRAIVLAPVRPWRPGARACSPNPSSGLLCTDTPAEDASRPARFSRGFHGYIGSRLAGSQVIPYGPRGMQQPFAPEVPRRAIFPLHPGVYLLCELNAISVLRRDSFPP